MNPDIRSRREMLVTGRGLSVDTVVVLLTLATQSDMDLRSLRFLTELRAKGHSAEVLRAATFQWLVEQGMETSLTPTQLIREVEAPSSHLVTYALDGPAPLPRSTTSTAQVSETRLGSIGKDRAFPSPDLRRVAFRRKSGEGFAMALDSGRAGPVFDHIQNPIWSANSQRVAYAASREGKWFVVVEDRVGDAYEEVSRLTLSPDGEHVSYAARTANPDAWWIISDGEQRGPYQFVTLLAYSPTGELAAVVRQDRTWQLRFADHTGVSEGMPRVSGGIGLKFSQTGEQVAYVTGTREYDEVRVRGARTVTYQYRFEDGFKRVKALELDADGSRVAYVIANPDGSQSAYVNGEKLLTADKIERLQFAPGDGPLAIVGTRGDEIVTWWDGSEWQYPGPFLSAFALSRKGNHIAYFLSDNSFATRDTTFVFDGEVKQSGFNPIREIHLSNSGDTVAWVEQLTGKVQVVIDGQPEKGHRRISHFALSPSGRHHGYFVSSKGGHRLFIDGKPMESFFDGVDFGTKPVISDDHYRALAIRRGKLVSVEVDFEAES